MTHAQRRNWENDRHFCEIPVSAIGTPPHGRIETRLHRPPTHATLSTMNLRLHPWRGQLAPHINRLTTCLTTCLATCLATAGLASGGLTFEETKLEFHPKPGDTHVVADFPFRNDGEAPVRIVKYDAACTCMAVTVAGGKLEYAPGDVGTVRATFRLAGYQGTTDRVVAIWLYGDQPASPSASLTVRAHIPQLVVIDPKNVTWDLNSDPEPKTISIRIDPSVEMNVTGVRSSSELFDVELVTEEAGRSYKLVILPKRTESPGIAAIQIQTDSDIESLRMHTVFGVVRNPIPK